MNKVIFLLAFSVLFLVPVGSQNVFAGPAECAGMPDGTPCNGGDGDFCNSTCQGGLCTMASSVDCSNFDIIDDCQNPSCNVGTGICSSTGGPSLPDGSTCNDNDVCSVGDICQSGQCIGGSPSLPDGSTCNDNNACSVGDTCLNGQCNPGPALNCDDGDACTGVESCDPATGCTAGTPPNIPACFPDDEILVSGEIIPIESTSLILANSQSFSWMIPVLLSGIGIGLFVFRKSEN